MICIGKTKSTSEQGLLEEELEEEPSEQGQELTTNSTHTRRRARDSLKPAGPHWWNKLPQLFSPSLLPDICFNSRFNFLDFSRNYN